MKKCGTGSARFSQLFWCYFPELILSGLQILGDKTAFITFSMIAVVFMLVDVYGMEKQNAIFISADCSDGFCSVF